MVSAGRGPRGKQSKRRAPRRADLTLAPDVPATCDCPDCTAEESEPAQALRELFAVVEALPGSDAADPLAAEVTGAAFVAMVTAGGDELLPALAGRVLPHVEAGAGGGTVRLLLAIGAIAANLRHRRAALEQLAEAASAAAERLVAAGVPGPRWSAELAEPVRPGRCLRLHDTQGTASVLVTSFERGEHGHALLIVVDEPDCGAAADILLVDADRLAETLDAIRESGRADGLDVRTQVLEPAELRWYAEAALAARAAHDAEGLADPVPAALDDAEAGPPYPVLAVLTHARLGTLPPARRPAGARRRAHADAAAALPAPDAFADPVGDGLGGRLADSRPADDLVGNGPPDNLVGTRPAGKIPGPRSAERVPATFSAPRTREIADPPSAATGLPSRRTHGETPIYQVKIGLRGAKPPIWRRLLIPADTSLADLHAVIQAAFAWTDAHLHVFETPYGDFGYADPDLGHLAEQPVEFEQVLTHVKDKIRYTYDFGDDWTHEILLEKVLSRDPTLLYPRCTGGRRAAPPEDCGGVWGYAQLVDILAHPRHPEHEDRLEWLGLETATQFDPAAFDADEINRALARLR